MDGRSTDDRGCTRYCSTGTAWFYSAAANTSPPADGLLDGIVGAMARRRETHNFDGGNKQSSVYYLVIIKRNSEVDAAGMVIVSWKI